MKPIDKAATRGLCDKLLVIGEICLQHALESLAEDAARGHEAARRVFPVKVPRLVVSRAPLREADEAGGTSH